MATGPANSAANSGGGAPGSSEIGVGLAVLDMFLPKKTSNTVMSTGSGTKQKVLSQEAVNKLIYDVMASDQGLAQLLSGEAMMGGSGSSSKTLMAQDFTAKLVGELAAITAPEVVTEEKEQTQTSKSKRTVICTALCDRGLLDPVIYDEGKDHFDSLSPYTVAGYRIWADWVVRKMDTSPRLVRFLTPIAKSRYLMTAGRKRFTFLGVLTIYIGQPICWLIGRVLVGRELAMQIAAESR